MIGQNTSVWTRTQDPWLLRSIFSPANPVSTDPVQIWVPIWFLPVTCYLTRFPVGKCWFPPFPELREKWTKLRAGA